jgi:hypothetical protein
MQPTTNITAERVQREIHWIDCGAPNRTDTGARVVELQDRLTALRKDHPHHGK